MLTDLPSLESPRRCVPPLLLGLALATLLSCDPPRSPTDEESSNSTSTTTSPEQAPPSSEEPTVVAPLQCKPSSRDGVGRASLDPEGPVLAGSRGSWTIEYVAPPEGIDGSGLVMVQISPFWYWTTPQDRQPQAPGYSKVTSPDSDVQFKAKILPLNRIAAFLPERGLKAGERLVFHYGQGAVADRFAESEEMFQVFVDGDGDGHYAPLPESPRIPILPRDPRRLIVNIPSQSSPNEPLRISIHGVDGAGNWSPLPEGDYRCEFREGDGVVAEQSLKGPPAALTLELEWSPPSAGIYFVHVEGPAPLKGKSNVLLCQEGERRLHLFFGDLHGHTRFSDGTGTPEEYYRFAQEVSALDFAALTDHDAHGTFALRGPWWERIKRVTQEVHTPGTFVTFLGYEWTNWTSGHRNVYYRDGEGPLLTWMDEGSQTPQELWRALKEHEAMTIAHHPGGGPIPIDWSIPPDPEVERLVELCSIHGVSESFRSTNRIYSAVEDGMIDKALANGYRLGFIGSGDTHDGHPGQTTVGLPGGGLVAVFSEERTRESIWAALKRRHTYATNGAKIILFARVGDSRMGEEIQWSRTRGPIPIVVRTIGCDSLERVEIVRNSVVVSSQKGDGVLMQLLLEDPNLEEDSAYYYARVVQKDGGMAWSSPVWVDFID